MKKLAAVWLLVSLPCVAPTVARADAAYDAAVHPAVMRRLDNGLTVVVQEDHRAPLVAMQLVFDAADDASPAGQEGAGALTTYCMLDATKHVGRGEYRRLLARAGASDVGDTTGSSFMRLSATVPSGRVTLPLWLWSDQMGFLSEGLDDARLAEGREQLRRQRQAMRVASPLASLDSIAYEELYPPGHPYRSAWYGPESVERLDRATVLAFHDRWYTPPHAVLVMVGDVVADDAFADAARYFGPIPGGAAGHLSAPAVEPLAGEVQIDMAASVPLATVSLRWPTPRLLTSEDARLDLASHLLSGRHTAWLYWKLVDTKKVATRVYVQQRSGDLGSQFEITIEGAAGRSAAELLAAYDTAMSELHTILPSRAALQGAAEEMLSGARFSRESPSARAGEMAKYVRLVGTPDYFAHDSDRYSTATAQQVRDAIDRWLPPDRRLAILVTPTAGAAPGGEKHGRRFTPARTP